MPAKDVLRISQSRHLGHEISLEAKFYLTFFLKQVEAKKKPLEIVPSGHARNRYDGFIVVHWRNLYNRLRILDGKCDGREAWHR